MTTARIYSLVQVAKKRKGSYYFVHLINANGTIKKRQRSLIVRFPDDLREVPVGTLWKVSGQQTVSQFMVGGYLVYEDVLSVTQASLIRPAQHTLSRWISINIEGIGEVIANRLVRQRRLEKWIRSGDMDALCSVQGMNERLASRLIEQWPDEGLYRTMEWLDKLDLSPSLGFKLVKLFGNDAPEQLTANPFLLLGLNVPYSEVLTVIGRLNLELPDSILAAGAAMHVVIRQTGQSGSTVVSEEVLRREVAKLTDCHSDVDPGRAACQQGLLVKVEDGYQSWGAALMEATVARKLAASLSRPAGRGALLASWECHVSDLILKKALAKYEQELPFTLSEQQRQAVIGALSAPVVGISGGAGTGKTTILRAIIGLHQVLADGLVCYPVALSGRAAQRMAESTGLPAQTIAKLIVDHLGDGKPSLPDHVLIIIDEASMVDLLSMYRLVGLLPEAARFIFIGDNAQLPPIGGGLIFHMLYATAIPFFELSETRRQSEQSSIHRFATAVREGYTVVPEVALDKLSESSDCCILSPPSLERLTQFWLDAGALSDRIILSPRRSGEWGVITLNAHFQDVLGLERDDLHYLDASHGWIPWITRHSQRLKQGDPILVTKNIYDSDVDVRNGDLGIITEVFSAISPEGWCGTAEINGEVKGITQDLLEVLDLGYAITIHKSQGSEWRTVFSVVTRDARHMLDASLIYTAATRPRDQLVLVADTLCLQEAIKRGRSASRRHVDIGRKLESFTMMHRRENQSKLMVYE